MNKNKRAEVVLSIVATDNTFSPVVGRPTLEEFAHRLSLRSQIGWMGRCIHCETHLYVTMQGSTESTIEHIAPLCDGGDPTDPHNLALACSRCNNEKGIRHDRHAGKGGRADEVIRALQEKRSTRWREVQVQAR